MMKRIRIETDDDIYMFPVSKVDRVCVQKKVKFGEVIYSVRIETSLTDYHIGRYETMEAAMKIVNRIDAYMDEAFSAGSLVFRYGKEINRNEEARLEKGEQDE